QPLAPADFFGTRMRSLIFVMGKIRRKFETEFKRQLIAQIEAGQTTVGQAARDHQISRSVIERWGAIITTTTPWSIDHPAANANWKPRTKSSRPRWASWS